MKLKDLKKHLQIPNTVLHISLDYYDCPIITLKFTSHKDTASTLAHYIEYAMYLDYLKELFSPHTTTIDHIKYSVEKEKDYTYVTTICLFDPSKNINGLKF